MNIVKSNTEILLQGSVLDPLNHPSYSEEKRLSLQKNEEDYNKAIDRIRKKYGK